MDNERFHNASNTPGKDLRLENITLRDELERKELQHEIGKLKLEKEVMCLNLELKSAEKLKEENEKLKEEVSELKSENKRLQPRNQTTDVKSEKNIPKLIPIKDRLIDQGVRRFIEGIESKTKVYDSYVQWYDDVSERMRHKVLYEYDKYLLIREHFNLGDSSSITYCSYGKDSTMRGGGFESRTLERGWTKENIKIVLILHPKNPSKFLEMNPCYSGKDQTDENGKRNYHYWKYDYENATESQDVSKVKETKRGKVLSVILCCIKY